MRHLLLLLPVLHQQRLHAHGSGQGGLPRQRQVLQTLALWCGGMAEEARGGNKGTRGGLGAMKRVEVVVEQAPSQVNPAVC